MTLSHIEICPFMPTPPPIVQLSPMVLLPAIPVQAAIAVFLPIVTLCAM